MSHTYVQNLLHVVFSAKERRRLIPLDFRPKLWAFMASVCSEDKILPHEIGGMDDHAHLLIQLPPTWSLSDAVQEIKTSRPDGWGRALRGNCGFAAFSVSASSKETVVRYVRIQDTHHKKMDYKSELIALLDKHGVPYDPKYVFDSPVPHLRRSKFPLHVTHGVAVG